MYQKQEVRPQLADVVSTRYFASYLDFFTEEIAARGVGDVLERYVFSPGAKKKGACMLLRFVGGA